MKQKCVVLGITGGIAAYKAADIVSRLKKADCEVYVVMTRNACEFVTPLTMESISGRPVAVDLFEREQPWEIEHISLAKRADLMLIAPASANFIGKLANGIADDMLSTTAMATTAPMLLAPAMNNHMYLSCAVQDNIDILQQRGCLFIGPDSGILACGDIGPGRMSQPEQIVERVLQELTSGQDMLGKKLLVTAGPTREYIDPVRYLSNPSSGKMGYALATQAARRGAEVTLISGPVALSSPDGVKVVSVQSSQDMYEQTVEAFIDVDAAVMAAAPADYAPAHFSASKIKKDGQSLALDMQPTQDIAQHLGSIKQHRKLVVFAAETDDVEANATKKLTKKNADMVVANDVSRQGAGFGADTNIVTFITANQSNPLPMMSKTQVANKILDEIVAMLSSEE